MQPFSSPVQPSDPEPASPDKLQQNVPHSKMESKPVIKHPAERCIPTRWQDQVSQVAPAACVQANQPGQLELLRRLVQSPHNHRATRPSGNLPVDSNRTQMEKQRSEMN